MLSRLGILTALLLALSAGSALAETDFPIVGGPGNGSFQATSTRSVAAVGSFSGANASSLKMGQFW